MTPQRLGSEELLERLRVGGYRPPGPRALGRTTFLLDPGGEDYVGSNSYDDQSQTDE